MTKLWTQDVSLLYTETQLWPYYVNSRVEKINAIARFLVYYGVMLSILKKDFQFVLIALVTAWVLTLAWPKERKMKAPKKPTTEIQGIQACPKVTVHNTMGNPVLGVHTNVEDNGCRVDPDEVNQAFLHNLPLDHWDIYGKNNSQRQFYTVPVNDQTAFAKMLYDPDIVMNCEKTQKACF
jgi:hypothetical protein